MTTTEAIAIGRAIHDALDDQYGGDLDIYLTSPNGPTADEVIVGFAEATMLALRANPDAVIALLGGTFIARSDGKVGQHRERLPECDRRGCDRLYAFPVSVEGDGQNQEGS